ncbi:hypothetical protein [Allosphingosinicella vermicomposti]|uniref:hypothetical protein n=1 Tax=Allosphingosinicella vermicomposti TaxID=614671 RepID=UPI00131A55A9|nr:hypothetical protein [Allosphingosinicella vermicomposti]
MFKIRFILCASLTALSLSACTGPTVLGQRLKKANVCPSADTGKCVQSTGNMTPIYIEKPARFANIDDNGIPVYWQYLGRMWTGDGTPVSNYCGNVFGTNPFLTFEAAYNADPAKPDIKVLRQPVIDQPFYFTRKAFDKKAIEGNIDVGQVLNLAGVPIGVAGRAQAEAKLKAMASRVANSKIKMEGNYHFTYIEPEVVAALFAENTPAELAACADYLRTNNAAIVTGMTGVYVKTLEVENSTQDKIDADLKVALNGILPDSKIGEIGLQWKREVDEVFRSETKPVFQVLSLSHYGLRNQP